MTSPAVVEDLDVLEDRVGELDPRSLAAGVEQLDLLNVKFCKGFLACLALALTGHDFFQVVKGAE